MMIIFVSGVVYHIISSNKPEDPRNINKKMKLLFNDYYNKEKDIKTIMVLNT